MRQIKKLLLAALAAVTLALAHHGLAAFDQTKKVNLVGTVTEFRFVNPHCVVEFEVKDERPSKEVARRNDQPSPSQRLDGHHSRARQHSYSRWLPGQERSGLYVANKAELQHRRGTKILQRQLTKTHLLFQNNLHCAEWGGHSWLPPAFSRRRRVRYSVAIPAASWRGSSPYTHSRIQINKRNKRSPLISPIVPDCEIAETSHPAGRITVFLNHAASAQKPNPRPLPYNSNPSEYQ